jgi:hypothetical protein
MELYGMQVDTAGPETALRVAAVQGMADGWPTLRSAADVLAIAALLDEFRLAQMMNQEPLVRDSIGTSTALISGKLRKLPGRRSLDGLAVRRRQWLERRYTDTLGRAAIRSFLGFTLPARRLSRGQSSAL